MASISRFDFIIFFNNFPYIDNLGKTSTTKMISHILGDLCNTLIGDGTGLGNIDAKSFVFEACEYKNTFLNYYPQILLVNNIDYDHPDFFKTKEDYFNSFNKLAMQSEQIVCNGDDENCKKLNVYNKITFGFNKDNDLVCKYHLMEGGYDLYLSYSNHTSKFFLPFYGKHMIYNFLGAFCVLHLLGISDEMIQEKLLTYTLPKRRGQTKKINNNYIICDYAHHPNEIRAFFETINLKYPGHKKIVIFESHTFSRSAIFKKEFKEVLSQFDLKYAVDIFSSVREKQNKEENENFFNYLEIAHYNEEVREKLLKEDFAVICFVGAGDIDKECHNFIQYLGC